jgi:hypothetical protein
VRLGQIKQLISIGNSEYAIQEIHDVLESYYMVAMKRFVDTVCMKVSDCYILTGKKSPLRVFGIAFVSQLSATQLDLIAREDVSTKQLSEEFEERDWHSRARQKVTWSALIEVVVNLHPVI